ncbi:ABC transporter permease [Halopiger djelfimassiliensis]|uniref:ABC transporter permease n=1 Tax=Halopiger djelfimassiliensis TaxID=1293047 RepID=UPI000677F8A8|nr:ABC transporter permease [Halopiger djelfimassiliensis]
MSTERGRIRISGFDPDRVEERESTYESDAESTAPEGRWVQAWNRFKRNRSAIVGLGIVAVMAVLAIFARPITVFDVTVQPFSIAPYEPSTILRLQTGHDGSPYDLATILGLQPEYDVGRYAPPSLSHPMGTDGSGRDLATRVLYGGRYSIPIGFIVVGITATVGTIYGSVSGYYGGWIDECMMRLLDVIFAFPPLVLALIIVAVFGGGFWPLVAAFSLFGWASYARIIRGEILKVKQNEYVMAAKALGARDRTVIFRHVVPNAIAPVIVQATLSIGTVVIGVAALGFLGVGFDPGTPEWGTMLNATRDTLIRGPGGSIPWWATIFPGGAIFLFVMAMNLIGDGINDALNAQEEDAVVRGGGG